MEHRDAEFSELTVVLKQDYACRLEEVKPLLEQAGMRIADVNAEVGVIEGTIETSKINQIRQLACVDALRDVFDYIADFCPGDPRDEDGEEPDDDVESAV